MGAIKNIVVAFAISFCLIFVIINQRVRRETFEVLNHNIGKSRFRVYQVFLVLISLIVILVSYQVLYRLRILNSLIVRKEEIKNSGALEVEESYEEE